MLNNDDTVKKSTFFKMRYSEQAYVVKLSGRGRSSNGGRGNHHYNRSNYATHQIERSKEARKLYHNIGAPTVEKNGI